MASMNAWHAAPSQGSYTASKHAVLGLVRTAALDLGTQRDPRQRDRARPGRSPRRSASGSSTVRPQGGLTVEEAMRRPAAPLRSGGW